MMIDETAALFHRCFLACRIPPAFCVYNFDFQHLQIFPGALIVWIARGFSPGLKWLTREDIILRCWGIGTEGMSEVSFLHRVVGAWNALPAMVVEVDKIGSV